MPGRLKKEKHPVKRRPKPKLHTIVSRTGSRKVERVYVGRIAHYYTKLGVGVIELERALRKGDIICIEGFTTKFRQRVSSMEYNHRSLKLARSGLSIGVKMRERVRENDKVYRIR